MTKSGSDLPKISIITPSYNQGQYIEETILSVLSQNYPNLEYIIIDGGSTDNTLEIVKKYEDRLAFWVSEKDNGQTHAINKGFAHATGEIFAYLNSDDCYYPNTLKRVADVYIEQNSKEDLLIIGNCFWASSFEDQRGAMDFPKFPNNLKEALLRSGLAPQPSMFWTMRSTQLRFCDSLQFCMDYEFWLQLIVNNYHKVYVDECFSLFRLHSAAKTHNLQHILMQELIGLNFIYRKFLAEGDLKDVIKYNDSQIVKLKYRRVLNDIMDVNLITALACIFNSELPIWARLKLFIKYIAGGK